MKRVMLAVALATASLVSISGAECSSEPQVIFTPAVLPVEGELPPLAAADKWLNSPPLTRSNLRGKVVLIDIWTYSCINWLRSLPYVRAWAQEYKDQGLVVIGVHAPEFGFERNLDNIRQNARLMQVDYPIAVDNDYAIWNFLHNEYWPALYLVDAKGHIRYHRFGEGEYERTESAIQQLLTESGVRDVHREPVSVHGRGVEAPADWDSLRSDENYIGYDRTQNFSSPGGIVEEKAAVYVAPPHLSLNHWALSGNWTIGKQAAALNEANGKIRYVFHARDLHLVMGSSARVSSVRFRVLVDGQPPGAAHGADVDEHGYGTVTGPRLYQLVREPGTIVDRQFEVTFLDPGLQAFSFTFG